MTCITDAQTYIRARLERGISRGNLCIDLHRFQAFPTHTLWSTLARLEGQEAFRALAQRFDALHLQTQQLAYQPSITFRSIKSMPVTWN